MGCPISKGGDSVYGGGQNKEGKSVSAASSHTDAKQKKIVAPHGAAKQSQFSEEGRNTTRSSGKTRMEQFKDWQKVGEGGMQHPPSQV
jgi:hypothetical protein